MFMCLRGFPKNFSSDDARVKIKFQENSRVIKTSKSTAVVDGSQDANRQWIKSPSNLHKPLFSHFQIRNLKLNSNRENNQINSLNPTPIDSIPLPFIACRLFRQSSPQTDSNFVAKPLWNLNYLENLFWKTKTTTFGVARGSVASAFCYC